MMAKNHAVFEEGRIFEFHSNECMISMFKHQQLLSSMHVIHVPC